LRLVHERRLEFLVECKGATTPATRHSAMSRHSQPLRIVVLHISTPCLPLNYPAADRLWTESEMAASWRVFREAKQTSSRCFSPQPTSTASLPVSGTVQLPETAVEAFCCPPIQFRTSTCPCWPRINTGNFNCNRTSRSADFDCDWMSTFEGPSSFAIRIKE
jgi:hypothetical protein